jgi:hypothetical protein
VTGRAQERITRLVVQGGRARGGIRAIIAMINWLEISGRPSSEAVRRRWVAFPVG